MKSKTIYLFYVFILVNTFFKGIGLDNDSKLYFICLALASLALLFKILTDKYTKKEFIFIIVSIIVGISTFIVTKKPTLLLTVLCLIGMKNVSVDDTFKKMYYVRFFTFFLVITLAFIGILDNTKIEMWRNGGNSIRYSLGYGHPNTLHMTLFILVALYIYNRYDKLKNIEYIVLIALNFFIYYFSVSRTGMILTLLLIVLTIVSKLKFKTIQNIIIKIPVIIFIALLLISFITGILYEKVDFMDEVNKFFNGRIAYSNYYLETYGFSLFGNNVQNDRNALFDNGYLYMYIQFGIAGFLYLTMLYFKIFKKIKKDKDLRKTILTICFLIYIFTESFSPNIFMNIILLFVAETIFLQKSKENVHKELSKGEIYNVKS